MEVRLDYLTSGPQFSHLCSEANKEKLIKSLHSSEHSIGISPNICWYYLYYYYHHCSATTTTVANHHSSTFPVTAFTITVTISTTLISSSKSRPRSLPDCPSPPTHPIVIIHSPFSSPKILCEETWLGHSRVGLVQAGPKSQIPRLSSKRKHLTLLESFGE